jgi:hypothetical protein
MRQKYKLTLIALCFFITSCSNFFKKENPDLITPPFEGNCILIIPPISNDPVVTEAVGKSMTSNLLHTLSSDVRYAADIDKLKPALNNGNLMADGQINMDEASKIGSAVNANEVICTRVTAYSPYPPQKIACVIMVRTLEGSRYRQRVSYVNVDLKNPADQKEFAQFAKGELRGPLGDRFIKKENVNAEAAMLSNNEFLNYVGLKVSQNILYMKKY